MGRRAELVAIEQYLAATQVSRCQPAYAVAMSAPAMSLAEEARRLGKVAAPSPAASALVAYRNTKRRGGASPITKQVHEFFASARLTDTFSIADIARAVFRTENLTQDQRDETGRVLAKGLPEGWRVLRLARNRRVFHHSSNPQRGSNG